MELTRAAQSSGQMQAALAPMLGGIEARLVQVRQGLRGTTLCSVFMNRRGAGCTQ